jgi:hypothetical protein
MDLINMRNLKNILLVSKMTEIETNEHLYGAAVDHYYRLNNIDVKTLEENHDYHYKSLDIVVDSFKKQGIEPSVIFKNSIGQRDFLIPWDLICVVGGDGTFMDVGRYVKDATPFFGIKSSPKSIGGHYDVNFSNAKDAIDKIFQGKYIIEPQTRIEGKILNGSEITDLALNDIFVGDKYSTGYSKLDINGSIIAGSGIVFSSYRGQSGWYNNIPLLNKDNEEKAKFNIGEKNFIRYKVLIGANNNKFEYGIIKPNEELVLTSKIFMDGVVAFDGNKPTRSRHRFYDMSYGAKVTIKVSDKPLYVVRIQ